MYCESCEDPEVYRPKLEPSLGSLTAGKVKPSVFLPINLTVSGLYVPLHGSTGHLCREPYNPFLV